MIGIDGLQHFADALARLDLRGVQSVALADQGEDLAAEVGRVLDQRPGGDHAAPWRRSGVLHDSIGSIADEESLVVGSSDPVAICQELGTATVPPRPFLAPAGASNGGNMAHRIGRTISDALRAILS